VLAYIHSDREFMNDNGMVRMLANWDWQDIYKPRGYLLLSEG